MAARVERLASSDAVLRTAGDIARRAPTAAPASARLRRSPPRRGWDVLDLVAEDGTRLVGGVADRFGYRISVGDRIERRRGAFLQAIELPQRGPRSDWWRCARSSPRDGGIDRGGRRLDRVVSAVARACRRHARAALRNVEPEARGRRLIDASGQVGQAAPLEPLTARVRRAAARRRTRSSGATARSALDAIPLAGRGRRRAWCSSAGRPASSRRSMSASAWSGAVFGAWSRDWLRSQLRRRRRGDAAGRAAGRAARAASRAATGTSGVGDVQRVRRDRRSSRAPSTR